MEKTRKIVSLITEYSVNFGSFIFIPVIIIFLLLDYCATANEIICLTAINIAIISLIEWLVYRKKD